MEKSKISVPHDSALAKLVTQNGGKQQGRRTPASSSRSGTIVAKMQAASWTPFHFGDLGLGLRDDPSS
jgi:hypothetical protein